MLLYKRIYSICTNTRICFCQKIHIDIYAYLCYYDCVRRETPDNSTGQEVKELEIDSMTQTELASYLETLAKLVEATAKDAQDAARIIREAIPKQ